MKIPALLLEMGKVDPKKSQKENETNVTESLIISFHFKLNANASKKGHRTKKSESTINGNGKRLNERKLKPNCTFYISTFNISLQSNP